MVFDEFDLMKVCRKLACYRVFVTLNKLFCTVPVDPLKGWMNYKILKQTFCITFHFLFPLQAISRILQVEKTCYYQDPKFKLIINNISESLIFLAFGALYLGGTQRCPSSYHIDEKETNQITTEGIEPMTPQVHYGLKCTFSIQFK